MSESRRRRGSGDRREEYVLIGTVARRFGVHPQTLRLYEREGLIRPARSTGNTRLYDLETVERLEIILTLTRDLGVNLAGVEVILRMTERMAMMEAQMREMQAQMISEIRRLRQALGEPVDAEVVSSGMPEQSAEPPRDSQ